MDATLEGLAEYPGHGDAAADPRQYRCARRWYECPPRPFQYPGADGHRVDVEPAARLSHAPHAEGSRLRHLHVDPRIQALTAQPDELLAELQEVLRQLPEVDVGRGRDP